MKTVLSKLYLLSFCLIDTRECQQQTVANRKLFTKALPNTVDSFGPNVRRIDLSTVRPGRCQFRVANERQKYVYEIRFPFLNISMI